MSKIIFLYYFERSNRETGCSENDFALIHSESQSGLDQLKQIWVSESVLGVKQYVSLFIEVLLGNSIEDSDE